MKGARFAAVVSALACAAALALAAGAQAHGHLDRSFGKRGVVDVRAALRKEALVGAVEAGPRGDVFFIEESQPRCPSSDTCVTDIHLRRYHAGGHLDHRFGRVYAGAADNGAYLAVDSRDRPVVAFEHDGRFRLRRFLPGGRADRAFGSAGRASLDCGPCYLGSIEPAPGGRLLVVGHVEPKLKPLRNSRWYIARLQPDGSFDTSFAKGGVLQRRMPGFYVPEASVQPGGGALLYGDRQHSEFPFVERLTAGGSLLTRFGAAANSSLQGLHSSHFQEFEWEELSVLARSKGQVTVITAGGFHTVMVGLRRDGRRDASFGERGLRRFDFEVSEAVPDGRGGAFFAAYRRGSGDFEAGRFTPDGRFDGRFGWVRLPGADDEYGMQVSSRDSHWAIVYSPGLPFCRNSCVAKPKLYRVVR